MEKKAGAPIIILIALIVIALSLAGGGFYMLKQEQKKNLDLQDKLEEINTKQRITETKLKESERFIADLQQKLQDAKSQIDTLSNGLQQEKSARQEALAKLELLRTDLEQQKTLRFDLEKKLTQAQDDVRKTQAQLSDLQAQKETLESKVKEIETKTQGVELGKIVVSPESAATEPKGARAKEPKKEKKTKSTTAPTKEKGGSLLPAQGGLEGKVLVVNKDYNFVVISLGSKDGLALGDIFSVYSNNKYIGDVKVEKVHDSMAAAGFVEIDIKDKVSEGDKVTQKVK